MQNWGLTPFFAPRSLRDEVVYQIYLRSSQDSDGDGVGDLPGIASPIGHVADLGADAISLSPFSPSPFADCGYARSTTLHRDIAPRPPAPGHQVQSRCADAEPSTMLIGPCPFRTSTS